MLFNVTLHRLPLSILERKDISEVMYSKSPIRLALNAAYSGGVDISMDSFASEVERNEAGREELLETLKAW